MTTQAAVEGFLAQRTLAVVGVSRNPQKFGNTLYRELKKRGYRVFPINAHAESVEGDRCYPNLSALPEPVGGVLINVPPAQSEQVVREAADANIRWVWLQQGAQSEAAIRFCEAQGLNVVAGECLFMFLQPMDFFHKPHRWLWRLLGKLPQESRS